MAAQIWPSAGPYLVLTLCIFSASATRTQGLPATTRCWGLLPLFASLLPCSSRPTPHLCWNWPNFKGFWGYTLWQPFTFFSGYLIFVVWLCLQQRVCRIFLGYGIFPFFFFSFLRFFKVISVLKQASKQAKQRSKKAKKDRSKDSKKQGSKEGSQPASQQGRTASQPASMQAREGGGQPAASLPACWPARREHNSTRNKHLKTYIRYWNQVSLDFKWI